MATGNTLTNSAASCKGGGLIVIPPPRAVKLDTLERVRCEMAKVYKAARRGDITTQDAARFIYMLSSIGKLIADSELERRIEKLEELHAQKS